MQTHFFNWSYAPSLYESAHKRNMCTGEETTGSMPIGAHPVSEHTVKAHRKHLKMSCSKPTHKILF